MAVLERKSVRGWRFYVRIKSGNLWGSCTKENGDYCCRPNPYCLLAYRNSKQTAFITFGIGNAYIICHWWELCEHWRVRARLQNVLYRIVQNAAGDIKHAIPPPSHGIDGCYRNSFVVLMGKLLYQLIVLDKVIGLEKDRAW